MLKWAAMFAALAAINAHALEGKVIGVADGDTLTILDSRKEQHKIRLAEIDSPESAMPYGQRSKKALSSICFGKRAVIRDTTKDRYQRVVGHVYCDGVHANFEMVRKGMAWVYVQYAARSSPAYRLEREARSQKLGLWADARPVPPWEWRQARRGGVVSEPARSQFLELPSTSSRAGGPVVANSRSRVYHLPRCPSYAAVSPKNRLEFDSEQAASAAGYRKAGNCR